MTSKAGIGLMQGVLSFGHFSYGQAKKSDSRALEAREIVTGRSLLNIGMYSPKVLSLSRKMAGMSNSQAYRLNQLIPS